MKVDLTRLKKGTSDVSLECQQLIEKLKSCSRRELKIELSNIEAWTFGKCELYHWIDVLDIFDSVLEEAAKFVNQSEWIIAIDYKFTGDDISLVLNILNFTTLLIEHSFSRHLYSSIEHLITLLQTCNMDVVLAVLNLLYMFSKRSNFISRLNLLHKMNLHYRVSFLAEVRDIFEINKLNTYYLHTFLYRLSR